MKKQLTIVALGDSITESGRVGEPCYTSVLYDRIVAKLNGNISCRLFNAGRGGGTTAGVEPQTTLTEISWVRDAVVSHKPQLVWIMLGFNDLRNCLLTEKNFITNMCEIITFIQEGCGATIVLADPPHMTNYEGYGPVWNCGSSEKSDRFCELIQQLGDEFGLPVAKVHSAMNHDDSLLQEDGIHPNERGQQKIAEAFWETMKDWDFEKLTRG